MQWSEIDFSGFPAITIVEKETVFNNIKEYTNDAICIDNTRDLSFFNHLLRMGLEEEEDTALQSKFIRLKGEGRFYKGSERIPLVIKLLLKATQKFTNIKIAEKKDVENVDNIIAKSNSRTLHIVKSIPVEINDDKNYILLEDAKELNRIFDIIDSIR